jgi:sugar (pentulose or hexulose) kinase
MKVIPVIAIFDVGKTNKKFFLFDEQYKIVVERATQFQEITDEDGELCENIQLLTQWVKDTLQEVLRMKKFEVKAVNFSTYGASFVYLDENGEVIAPLYNYLKVYPEELKQKFYADYGGEELISRETASPVLGSLNSGMQLYRIKYQKPELYQKIKYALHLPQYLRYVVTHEICSDITSIGCHTQLWNFAKKDYHRWVKEEGIIEKLGPLFSSDKAKLVIQDGHEFYIGTGLHDSSAALIPYLSVFSEPFVLISTGTWCISLNPFNDTPLITEELQKDCLCYIEYHGRPVKASRLFAGNEHELQTKRLAAHYGKPVDYYKKVKYSAAVVASLQAKYATVEDAPSDEQNNSLQFVFGQRDLSAFSTYDEAYHCLIMDIMQKQFISTQLVVRHTKVKRIFVDGGFSNNIIYMHLLAAMFPNLEVFAASVAQATAVGAALSIHQYWNTLPIVGDMVELKYYSVSHEVIV